MKACFGDTSYFLALLIPADANHVAARQWAQSNRRPIVTTEYVLLEVANFLSAGSTRRLFGGFLWALRCDRRITLISTSAQLTQRGIDLYLARPDKSWSLTDCISFVIMNEQELTDALTADRHFEQAGFTPLLNTNA